MSIKTMSTTELHKAKEEAEKQFCGLRECLNSLDIRDLALIKPDVSKIIETFTNVDILEAIKRIAK